MSQLTTADCWPRRFPLFAGAAVLRGSHPCGTAAVCQSQRRRGRRPALAGAAGIGGAGELSSVYGSAGGQRAFCRARLAGMASPLRRRSGAPGRALSTLASPAGAAAARRSRRTDLSFAVRCAAAHPRALRRCQPRPGGERFLCDGRYNLACGEGAEARKIVGTAQYWRPLAAGGGHVVLAHAVILIDADLSAAHQAANAFEAQLGSERVYCADKTVTLAQLLPGERHLLPRFSEALAQELDASR